MTGGSATRAGAAAALLLLGAAASARAETSPPLSQNPNAFNGALPRKSLQLDASGRWTLRLDMEPLVGDEVGGTKDMQAGAYFHITPSIRVGGSVGLGDRQADAQHILPQDANAARVHVETKFKF